MADEQNGGQAPRAITLDDVFEYEGEKIKIGDLVQAIRNANTLAEEVNDLRQFRSATDVVMRGSEDRDRLASSARIVMKNLGYEESEITNKVSEFLNSQYAEENEASDEEPVSEKQSQEENKMANNDPRVEAAMNEARRVRLRMMEQEMKNGVVSAIDGNQELAKMLMGLDKTRGREQATGAYEAIQEQVRKATLERLYTRRDKAGGEFNEDWIAEESAKAAQDVAKSYSTVIGDLGQLGRAPETVSEVDSITSKPPVPPPDFKKGMDRGDVDKSIREFNTDALTRLAAEVSAGGETKA